MVSRRRGQLSIEAILITLAVLVAASVGAYVYLRYVSRGLSEINFQAIKFSIQMHYSCKYVALSPKYLAVKLILNKVPTTPSIQAFVFTIYVVDLETDSILYIIDLNSTSIVGPCKLYTIEEDFTIHFLNGTTRSRHMKVYVLVPQMSPETIDIVLDLEALKPILTSASNPAIVTSFWVVRGGDLYEVGRYEYPVKVV
ncbi:MAG: hypothetical protein DRJ40_05855 [Thermoprotei archaeon]|nr:MAG: hypothetical protein DRJ40_05855 [Thermoprotei archaeon]